MHTQGRSRRFTLRKCHYQSHVQRRNDTRRRVSNIFVPAPKIDFVGENERRPDFSHDFSRGRSQMLRSTTNVFPTRPVAKLWKACVDASSGDNPGSQERRESRRVGTRVLVKCLGVKWFEKLRLSSASETEGFADDEGTSIPRAAGAKRRLYRESKIRSVMEDCVFRTTPWHSPRLPVKSI